MKKKIIIGLGNPKKKYKYTRHNIGYLIIQLIISNYKNSIYYKKNYNLGKIFFLIKNNIKLILLLSNLYMNNVGISVNFFLKKFKLKSNNLIIISDDIYLNFGKIKIKKNSGHGGHNGLKNIQNILKTKNYKIIKIGIGHKFKYGQQNKYVLSKINKKELINIKKNIYKKIYNLITN